MKLEEGKYTKARILWALAKKRKWLHSHTPLTNMIKWVYVKNDGRVIRKLIKELRREGMVIIKPTHYGEEISLNPYQSERIKALIKKYFGEEI